MSKDFKNELNELRKNVEIMDGTFEKFGLEVMNIGFQYDKYLDDERIKVFCEIMLKEKVKSDDDSVSIKVNIYDSENKLLSMGSDWFYFKSFSGYDTYVLEVLGKNLFENAAKARVYAT